MLIDVGQAKPGMKLMEDVLLPTGAVLVNASQQLTSSLIETIIKRGIQKIQVVHEETVFQSKPQSEREEKVKTAINKDTREINGQKTSSTCPKIRIFPSKDEMSAKLCIEPAGGENEILAAEDIISELDKAGVVHGIDSKAISEIVLKWKQLKRYYEVDNIAKGTPPQPAREGIWEMAVTYIGDVETLSEVRKAHYFWEIQNVDMNAQRVDHDTPIAVKQPDMPAVQGVTVKGKPVITDEVASSSLSLDDTVRYSADNKKIYPASTGIAFFINAAIGVCSIEFDGSSEISVSSDYMKAEITLHPPGERGNHPSIGQIEELIKGNRIIYGIFLDDIKEALLNCTKGLYPENPVIVARGTEPVNGENGKVDFLFNIETSLKPKVNPNGTVDYKNVELVVTATKGQELAKLVPPTKGIPGKDILGRLVPAVDGAPAKLPVGTNTECSPIATDVLIASTDGNVKYNGNAVEISEGFVVKGNVDFSIGNIKYAKSVVIEGDIDSGFMVDCGGDLQVAGTIEDAHITVGGNVLCKFGFVGQGKGIIDAKGDVNLAFMKNQTVKCLKNVVIAKEAINCNIFARKTVTVHGKPLSISGGKVMARDNITAYSIGNCNGIKTIVEIGTDFSLIEELQKTETQLTEIIENSRKLSPILGKYEKLSELKHGLDEKDHVVFMKIRATMAKYQQQIKALEERKKIISANMMETVNSVIKIEHSAMPGTVFKIGARLLSVKEEIIGPKSVRLMDGEIKVY
jgi:uncharacterized protein